MERRHGLGMLFVLALLAPLALAGCDHPMTDTPDVGARDAASDVDGASTDDERPRVVATTPADGATNVAPDRDVVVTFSEAMTEAGTLAVHADGVALEVASSLEGPVLTVTPPLGWPPATEIEIRLDDDWADLAGNTLAAPFVMRFLVDDTGAPHVVSSSPAESATGVPRATSVLRIEFSEPMDQAAGSPSLEGGPGRLDVATPSWGSDHVTYALEGLAHDTSYRVRLDGYRDLSGNALDATLYLDDGAIDFTTGSDGEAPRVVDTTPNEAQVDVSIAALAGIVTVVFDEDMDTSLTGAALTVGASTTAVSATWADARTARFDVAGAFAPSAAHSLDLRSMRDVAGNPLDPAPLLVDGRLDFVTGLAAFEPYVAASEPAEGATSVANPLRDARIAFSEAMDESITSVPVTAVGGASTRVIGTWSNGGTVLTLPGSAFSPGRLYAVDVRDLRDLAGVPVSATHPYLGNGILDFALARPTGESCAQPLELEHATSVTDGVYEFVIPASQRVRYNGSASCDFDGVQGGDAVIHVHKTSPAPGDPSDTGRALRIRTYGALNRANVEVLSSVCDPLDPSATRVRCAHEHEDWDLALPVGPGDYYVWVSTESGSAATITVSIEEIDLVPEGQSCVDPYDTSSIVYTAPATPDAPHVFDVPPSMGASVDITDTNDRFQALSCVAEVQDDVVVRFDKAADDTVLDVRVVPGGFGRRVEIVSGACQRSAPGAASEACGALSNQPQRFTVHAPAGPVHVWLASQDTNDPFGGARVEIRELPAPTAPGSTCANAIPITSGATVPITPTHAERFDAPSCLPEASGVTWYALTTTEALTHVRADLDGAIALVDGATAGESSCATTASAGPLYHFAPVGSRLCVAVQSGSAISSLSIDAIPYAGVGAEPPTTVPAPTRPSLASTPYDDSLLVNETWTVLTPSRIVQNFFLVSVVDLPRAGGDVTLHLDFDSRVMGHDAVAVGEQVFMTSSGATVTPRLFRLFDATGAWSPIAWDRDTPAGTYVGTTKTIVSDGADLYGFGTASSLASRTPVYRWPDDAPAPATRIGEIAGVYEVAGAAIDGASLYLCARTASGSAVGVRGIYRVARADLTDDGLGTATLVASVPVATTTACQVVIDDGVAARYLYVRDQSGNVHVIDDPGGAPRWLGIVFAGDPTLTEHGMDLDRASGTLVVFSTRDDVEHGDWFELRP